MNLRPSRREAPDINLTPLIDVVFLLLIFFMVSTTFRKESDIRIDLPEASPQAPASVDSTAPLEVSIDTEGNYFVNGQALADTQPSTLKTALLTAADGERKQTFIIRAAAETPYQAVVTAMDIAGQLGFRRLAIPIIETQRDENESVDDS